MTTTAAPAKRIETLEPATGATLAAYDEHGPDAIDAALAQAVTAFRAWRSRSFAERAALLRAAAATLRARKPELAELAVREMGKTIVEAEAEVEKSATGCDYYAEHGAAHLADRPSPSGATESYVAFRPLGVLLAIMPWNFPYWQVFRAAAPALMAGNTVVLKHAANVTGTALEIERIFAAAGFPAGAFRTLVVSGANMEAIVADPRIAAVTLTGSEGAGSAVAATAGKHLKKTVLELGGSDAYIVLADADIEAAAKTAVKARFQNNGQSCIAAKRFIIEEPAYDAFLAAFVKNTEALVAGDPLDRNTTLGPVAREDLREALERQVAQTLAAGATLATGGRRLERPGYFYAPTIVGDVRPGMAMFDEETFGPAAAVIRARDAEHAIELANASHYGLGGNLWTRDVARGKAMAARLESGGVFINGMTASDPRLPFGGVKKSGYGRELSAFGIHEFVNIQTVWIGPARDPNAHAQPASE
jgi:succinate-semialdehyde dehydrogenase/glutarate-semialdehyde dehydrogenase